MLVNFLLTKKTQHYRAYRTRRTTLSYLFTYVVTRLRHRRQKWRKTNANISNYDQKVINLHAYDQQVIELPQKRSRCPKTIRTNMT